jgi:hypothetical protein
MPHVGGAVWVVYLDATVSGVVQVLDDGGRRITVLTEDGETLTFALNRATARFTDHQTGARLMFDSAPGPG